MAEKIGLQAVLELSSFSRAVSQYNSAISGMSKNTASTASSISSSFTNLGSGILKVGAIAAGAGVAGIAALTAGLLLLGSTALTEFAKYERMALSIQSLVARELSQGKLVEQQRTVAISLTKKEAQELEGLAGKIHDEELARNTLHARIKEQSEALRQLRDAHGDEALDVQTATARLAELENQYNKSGAEIQAYKDRQVELTNQTGEYVTVIDKVRTGQISMNEAMAQASPRAEELLKWIQLLAIQSPFDSEGVANAFRTALAYGFTTEEAQRLTEAELDFVAATGQSIAVADGIALALGQMRARGKVSAEELNQLSERGLGVNQVLETMGFTLNDVTKGLVPVDALIEALIKDMEIFEGAGKKQSTTFAGLMASLSDLKSIGLREFFTGTFTAIQPYLASFVGALTDAALNTGKIRELGDALGVYVAGGIQKIIQFAGQLGEIFGTFQTGGIGGLVAALGITPDAISLIEKFRGMITQIADTISGPLMAAFSGLSGGGILDGINQAITFLNDHFVELQGALLAIGAIAATGVFAALVAGIMSLVTPFTVLTGAIVLFSTAWAGNWGNIQGIAQQALAVLTTVFNTLSAIAISLADTIMTNVWPPLKESFNNITAALNNMGISWTDIWNALVTATKIVATILGGLILGLIATITGLVTGFANAFATITSYAVEFQNHIVALFKGLMQAGKGFMDFLTGVFTLDIKLAFSGLETLVTGVLNTIKAAFSLALTSIQGTLGGILSFVKGWMQSFTGFFDKLAPALGQKFENTWVAIRKIWKPEKWFELGQSVIEGILEGIKKNQAQVLEMLKDLAKKAIQSAKDALGFGSPAKEFIPLGKSIPEGVAVGINAGAGIAQSALDTLMTGLKVTDSGFIDKFIDDLNMGGIAKAAGTGGGQWKNFRNILKNEITANMQGLADGSINFMQHITDVASRFHFPANLAREFAKAQGLVEHLTGTFAIMFQKLRIENMAASIGIANNFSSIGSSFADMIQEQLTAFEKSKEATLKLNEESVKLSEVTKNQQEKLAELKAELLELTTAQELDTEAISKKQEQIAELTKDIEANSKAVEANRIAIETARQKLMQSVGAEFMADATDAEKIAGELAKIQLLTEFLAGDQDQLTIASKLQTVYGEVLVEQHLDRVKAQEELNKLTAEQARREQEIIRQREAQAKLDFLGQQINLIKLISDRGLNPRDILGGITLGLQAGATDLLAATNRVVEAMVAQINTDLQMGSPSRLMIKTFKQVMAGAAIGMERGQSLLSDAVRSIPILNGSIPQPVFSQAGGVGGSSSTYNYNFPMTVNTAATAPAVVRQYEIKRSMYAN